MSTGESNPSEPSGYRPPGQGEPGPAPEADPPFPGPSWPAPGQQPSGGYPPPGQGSYPPPGQPPHDPWGGYPPAGGASPPGYGQAGYGQQGYPQQGHRQQGFGQSGAGQSGSGGPLSPQEERTWAMAAHLSSILGVLFGVLLGPAGPLVVLLVMGPRSPYVRAQSVEALNFNISILVYSIIAWILALVLVGFVILAALFVIQIVFTVIATIRVSNGETYRYPLTFRLIH